jgi:hypothetical protein
MLVNIVRVKRRYTPRSNIPASINKRILVGTGGENQRIRQESSGNHRIMGAVFRAGMSSDFSGDFRPFSHRKSSEVRRKSPEKSDDIPDRNTASMIRWFPLNSGRIRSVRFDLGPHPQENFLSVVTTQQFHLVFVEFIPGDHYLIELIEEFIQSEYIQTKSFSSCHCIFKNELLNNILKVA